MRVITPGELLKEEFMVPLDLSANKLAAKLEVTPNRIMQIINGSRRLTSDTALRLAKLFGTSPQFWMNLQSTYELRIAQLDTNNITNINRIHPLNLEKYQCNDC